MTPDPFDLLGGLCFGAAMLGLFATTCETGKKWGREEALDQERTGVENSKCALRGFVLLRGQLGEFVCVTPGSERGRRTP